LKSSKDTEKVFKIRILLKGNNINSFIKLKVSQFGSLNERVAQRLYIQEFEESGAAK